MTDHPKIWLQPWCAACEASGEDRTWCWDDVYDPCDCGAKPVQYVNADHTNAENDRLREALERLIAACDRGRVVTKPGCGIGGMTLEANLRASNINGVSASAVEEARAALGEEKK